MKSKPSQFKSEESRRKVSKTARKTVNGRYDFMLTVAPYLQRWKEKAKPYTCVVCGENMKIVLDKHHIDPSLKGKEEYNHPDNVVLLCASCHRIFDKKGGSVSDFLERHKRRRSIEIA
ncbi:MAG: HNH endonuclease [archaeon]|nr:HNH endonuclease [archaeon]MCP8313474.1 HNH endonuclease [archaeon]